MKCSKNAQRRTYQKNKVINDHVVSRVSVIAAVRVCRSTGEPVELSGVGKRTEGRGSQRALLLRRQAAAVAENLSG